MATSKAPKVRKAKTEAVWLERTGARLLAGFGDGPDFLILFLFAQSVGGGQARFFAVLGRAILPVDRRPQPTDLLAAQKAQHI